jgi:hypothetical protein
METYVGWESMSPKDKESHSINEGGKHRLETNHRLEWAQDMSWLCTSCNASFDMRTGTLEGTSKTLDDLKKWKYGHHAS